MSDLTAILDCQIRPSIVIKLKSATVILPDRSRRQLVAGAQAGLSPTDKVSVFSSNLDELVSVYLRMKCDRTMSESIRRMMMTTKSETYSFASFATHQLNQVGADVSLDEIYDQWRSQNPTESDLIASVSAVRLALMDMKAGDSGTPATEHLARLRAKFHIDEDR
jgi:hypothetical protein